MAKDIEVVALLNSSLDGPEFRRRWFSRDPLPMLWTNEGRTHFRRATCHSMTLMLYLRQ